MKFKLPTNEKRTGKENECYTHSENFIKTFPTVLTDAWAWQHFPLAIEGPRELWRTLAGYSKDTSDEYVLQNYQCEIV